MGDQIATPIDFTSAAFRAALALVRLRMRRWIARRRRSESLPDLSDWILRDIGVMRERDMGAGHDADPREAARQFWRQ
jgi:uncharacterized protein YjiS (DUF1127 family)